MTGPSRTATVRLILDTGATTTWLKRATLAYPGIDLAGATRQVQMTTRISLEFAPVVQLSRLFALGQNRIGFSVVEHTLPDSARVAGLLGLDFSRGHDLTLDFPVGLISVLWSWQDHRS